MECCKLLCDLFSTFWVFTIIDKFFSLLHLARWCLTRDGSRPIAVYLFLFGFDPLSSSRFSDIFDFSGIGQVFSASGLVLRGASRRQKWQGGRGHTTSQRDACAREERNSWGEGAANNSLIFSPAVNRWLHAKSRSMPKSGAQLERISLSPETSRFCEMTLFDAEQPWSGAYQPKQGLKGVNHGVRALGEGTFLSTSPIAVKHKCYKVSVIMSLQINSSSVSVA